MGILIVRNQDVNVAIKANALIREDSERVVAQPEITLSSTVRIAVDQRVISVWAVIRPLRRIRAYTVAHRLYRLSTLKRIEWAIQYLSYTDAA